jgi:hypothetical protein
MSTKLLTEQMFSELYKPMVNSLNGAWRCSAANHSTHHCTLA